MKHTIFSLLLTLSCVLMSRAQEKKFEWVLNLFPSYSIGILTNDGTTPSSVRATIQHVETWKPSLSASVLAEYRWTEKSILGIGLGYQNSGERTKKLNYIFGSDIFPGNTAPDPSLPKQGKFIYNNHNLSIPLYYRHVFGKKFFGQIGTSVLLNVSNTSTSVQYFADGSVERKITNDNSTEFRKVNVAANLGFGWDLIKTEKLTFYILPQAHYGIFGLSKKAPLNRNILLLGVSTGIRL
jgi:hypothetical protein